MKKAKILTLFLTLSGASNALYAEPLIPENILSEKMNVEPAEDELITIERIIHLTDRQLMAQKKIRALILDIRYNKELFLKGAESKLHAKYMLKSAKEALELIRSHHLYHLFSSDFMEELALFAAVGTKHE